MTAPSNKGKTSSIKLAAQLFHSRATTMGFPPSCVVGNLHGLANSGDYTIIFEIPQCRLRIAFTSAGDWENSVRKNIDDASNNNCHILITATRAKGGSVDAVRNICKSKSPNEAIWIRPVMQDWCPPTGIHDPAGNFHKLHELSADHILNVLKHAIKYVMPGCTVLMDE